MAGRQPMGVALDAPDNGPLAAALQRNVFADGSEPGPARQLAVYVREAARSLAAQDGFERSRLAFPDPEQVLLCARGTRIAQ